MNEVKASKERYDPQYTRFDLLDSAEVRLITHEDVKELVYFLEKIKDHSVMAQRLYNQWYEIKLRYPVADFRLRVLVGEHIKP